MGTNIRYEEDERELVFIREREEKESARKAFHKFHQLFEDALDRTKYFRSYRPEVKDKGEK